MAHHNILNTLLRSYLNFTLKLSIRVMDIKSIEDCWALEELRESLITLPYNEFLLTPFWQTVRAYVLFKNDFNGWYCGSRNRF